MTSPIVSIIVAVAQNGVIGSDGDMPWRLSTDLKRFKEITLGKPIIMGRKTYQSIGRALPGRLNVVVSRSGFAPLDVVAANSLENAITIGRKWANENQISEVCIIGGGQIYKEAIDFADRIYMTHVIGTPEGDTIFPDLADDQWHCDSRESVPIGEKDNMETIFAVYERKK